MTPDNVQKLLTNIRKTLEHEKRKKSRDNADKSDEDDEPVVKAQPETYVSFTIFAYAQILFLSSFLCFI